MTGQEGVYVNEGGGKTGSGPENVSLIVQLKFFDELDLGSGERRDMRYAAYLLQCVWASSGYQYLSPYRHVRYIFLP